MIIDLEIKNYRPFSDSVPARMRIGPGFTALVGANNAGKSSLLRFLYDYRPVLELMKHAPTMIQLAKKEPYGFHLSDATTDALFHNGNERPLSLSLRANFEDGRKVKLEIRHSRDNTLLVDHHPEGANLGYGTNTTYPDADLDQLLKTLTNTMYVGAFRNALNFAPTGPGFSDDRPVYFDLRMGRQFVDWWQSLKTGRHRRDNERALKLTRDLARLFGLNELEINTASGGELQLFVDGRSYRLAELGSGLTQFLVVLANAAQHRPSWILIDEPELNLHPSLQLGFLTTLASYAQFGVVFATHSIGLARSVAERIYACTRDTNGGFQVKRFEAVQSLPEFLGELSFSTHRELGFDTVLLVEGATEVPVLQELLRRLGKERRVVLLPLGGSGTINSHSAMQLSEVKRISTNVAALIDSERAEPGAPLPSERKGFVEDCRKLGIDCHVLERRAIENYLPERAIKAAKGESFRALGPYELLKDLPLRWPKSDNWRIMAETRMPELEGTDLLNFLNRL